MKDYYVYSHDPKILENHGEVYYPRLRTSFVLLRTSLELHEIRNIEGVYDARECEIGHLCLSNEEV